MGPQTHSLKNEGGDGTGQAGTLVWVSGRKGTGREVGSWQEGVTPLAEPVVLQPWSWKAKERKLYQSRSMRSGFPHWGCGEK